MKKVSSLHAIKSHTINCHSIKNHTANRYSKKNSLGGFVKTILTSVVIVSAMGVLSTANATTAERTQAKRMYDRLIGVPPTEADLNTMEGMMGDPVATALWAINSSERKSEFYGTTLKNFFMPYTNEESTRYQPLNDSVATMIGMVRDGDTVGFDQVLYGDILYKGTGTYSRLNNDHYKQLEDNRVDLSDPQQFIKTTQSAVNPVLSVTGNAAHAGVITTRAFGEAYFNGGTNRAMFSYVMKNFMCREMEELKDVTRVPDRIRQDVSRSPGGDSSIYLNSCIGCHAGMDPMAAAYIYYDWVDEDGNPDTLDGHVEYNSTIKHDPKNGIKHKYLINSGSFPQGYISRDDLWENYWREGKNSELGWDSSLPSKGQGPTSLGMEFGRSDAFALCQVEKVYKHVCLQSPNLGHQAGIIRIKEAFKTGYNMKTVFAETAALCKGQ